MGIPVFLKVSFAARISFLMPRFISRATLMKLIVSLQLDKNVAKSIYLAING